MKISASALLTFFLCAQVTIASPFLFGHDGKKTLTESGTKPSPATSLLEGRTFWNATVALRKPQFEKFGICEKAPISRDECPELFPRSCGLFASRHYCGKTKEDCKRISETEPYYYCDIFHSIQERDRLISAAYTRPRGTSTTENFGIRPEEQEGIERVASRLCSPSAPVPYSCPKDVSFRCGYYCAKSEDACVFKAGLLMQKYITYTWPLRLNTKTCDTFDSPTTLQDGTSKSVE